MYIDIRGLLLLVTLIIMDWPPAGVYPLLIKKMKHIGRATYYPSMITSTLQQVLTCIRETRKHVRDD